MDKFYCIKKIAIHTVLILYTCFVSLSSALFIIPYVKVNAQVINDSTNLQNNNTPNETKKAISSQESDNMLKRNFNLDNEEQSKQKFAKNIKISAYGDKISVNYNLARTMCLTLNYQTKEDYNSCTSSHTNDYIKQVNDLKDAKYDIIITQSTIQKDVLNGINEFKKDKTYNKLRFLFSLHTLPITLITKKISKIQSINDLAGKKIDVGQNYTSKRFIDEWVTYAQKDPQTFFLQTLKSDIKLQVATLCNDQVAAIVLAEEQPSDIISKITTSCNVNILNFKNVDDFIKLYSEYVPAKVSGGDYLGIPFPIDTLGSKITVLSSSDVDESTIYDFTKLIVENLNTIKQLHHSLNGITIDSMFNDGVVAPIHNGVLKYLSEIGYDLTKLHTDAS